MTTLTSMLASKLKQTTTGLLLLLLAACGQVTIVVDSLPLQGPSNEKIYVTGNFNYWDPGDRRFQLEPLPNGKYAVTLPSGWGQLEYKFTRGDWTTVETQPCGEEMPKRTLRIGGADTVHNQIFSWHDVGLRNCQRVTVLVQPPRQHLWGEPIYIAGTFNDWQAADPTYRLNPVADGLYAIVLNKREPVIEFKFTRGEWLAEELDEYGNTIENRVFTFGMADTVHYKVPHWKDRLHPGGDSIFLRVSVPANTPEGQHVYVSGPFNGWSASSQLHKLKEVKPNIFAGSIPARSATKLEPVEFKFTRGTWNSVECDLRGYNVENRKLTRAYRDTLTLEVVAWRDLVK